MDTDERKLSKLYRRIITSDETQAFILFQKLDDKVKEEVRLKFKQNGSKRAIEKLTQLKKI